MHGTAASRTRDAEIVRLDKRANLEMSTPVDNPNTEVNKSAPDPECAASLVGYGEAVGGSGRALLCTPYPLTEHEPVPIELDEGSRAALASGKEDTDPLDYQAEAKVHGLVAAVRAYIATDESAAREAEAMAELGRATAAKSELDAASKAKGHFPGSCGHATHPDTVVAQKRVDEAEAAVKAAKQSSELRAEQIKVVFNPADTSFTVQAEYINHTGRAASVAISLPRTQGLTLNDVDVDIHGYTNKSEYQPIKQAQEHFKRACAAKDKSASLQAMDKLSHSVTVKIPAWKGGTTAPHPQASFTARFKLSCDDAEGKALLLPTKPGQPTHEASDFAVQLPAQDPRGAVPFALSILQSPGTSKLALPSRAAAKLDAARRGVPTYWIEPPVDVEPDARGRNGCLAHVHLDAPARQPPCFRFRFVNESEADCDFVTAALQGATLKSDVASAKVLCYAPTSEDECVALVELAGPQCRGDVSNAPGKVKHIVVAVDLSGSMGARVPCGCDKSNRRKACEEVALLAKKLPNLPRVFADAKITSKNDAFVLTIIGFHCSAHVVCERVPVVPGCAESAAALAQATEALCSRTDTGGTQYASWAAAARRVVKADEHVALALLTDGALWDEAAFTREYAALKDGVEEFQACAIGCGAWANHATVKLVATEGGGEALIEQVDASVSSTATRLLGRCIASMATKYTVVVEDHVLSHQGDAGGVPRLVANAQRPRGVDAVYAISIGAKRVCAMLGSYGGNRVTVAGIAQVDAPNFSYKVEVDGADAPRDVMRVLRHTDPLFASGDVHLLKSPLGHAGLNEKVREALGVYNQTTTSSVVKYAEYDLGVVHDNSLRPGTKAVVPPLARTAGAPREGLEWLRPSPSGYHPPAVMHAYERKPHVPCAWGGGLNDDGNCVFRSLGAGDGEEAQSPRFRSCGGFDDSSEPMDTQPPPAAPPPAAKAEVEKPKDDNVTPTFDDVAKLHYDVQLLPYLMDGTLAHIAAADLVKELLAIEGKLEVLCEGGEGGEGCVAGACDVAMDDVVSAALDRVAGPSVADVAGKLWPLLSALSALAMRHHLPAEVNLFNETIPEGDADKALMRATYLRRIACMLRARLSKDQPKLWRAKLVVGALGEGEATVKGSLTWVEEVRARVDDTVADAPDNSIRAACTEYAAHFDAGGYLGGTFAGLRQLCKGAEPPSFKDKAFVFGAKLVLGEEYCVITHGYEAMLRAFGTKPAPRAA